MKYNLGAAIMGVLVSLFSLAIVVTGSATPWGKVKYGFAVILLGVLVYYIGDKC